MPKVKTTCFNARNVRKSVFFFEIVEAIFDRLQKSKEDVKNFLKLFFSIFD